MENSTSRQLASCKICDKKFANTSSLKNHQWTHINGHYSYEKQDVLSSDSDSDSSSEQENSPESFSSDNSPKDHKMQNPANNPLPKWSRCQLCSEQFPTPALLEQHQHAHHVNEEPFNKNLNNTNQQYYDSAMDKPVHIEIPDDSESDSVDDEKDTLYRCDICGKLFTDPTQMARHKQSHAGVKMFMCDICSKYFTERSHLLRHQRTHTGEKPFGCEVCGRQFARSDKLLRHKRIHTGEKPYHCPICGKEFGRSDKLLQHKRTHLV